MIMKKIMSLAALMAIALTASAANAWPNTSPSKYPTSSISDANPSWTDTAGVVNYPEFPTNYLVMNSGQMLPKYPAWPTELAGC
jgi:hypothetical protein